MRSCHPRCLVIGLRSRVSRAWFCEQLPACSGAHRLLFAILLGCVFLPVTGLCAPGTFKDLSSEECMPCFGAEYNPYTNATACLACLTNSSGGALNIAESDCVCNRGFSDPAGGPCVLCEMGSFKTEHSSDPCTYCSSGAYWPSDSQPTANYCLACAENSSLFVPADGMCVCNRGFVWRNNTCYECAAGSYYPDQGSEHSCPLHTHSDVVAWGLAQCACVPGFYCGHGNCSICPVDFFCAGGAPQQCTTNSTTMGNPGSIQSSDCKCVPGFYKHANGQCLPCERGSFCFGDKQLACPSNSSAPALAKCVVECVCDAGAHASTKMKITCNSFCFFCFTNSRKSQEKEEQKDDARAPDVTLISVRLALARFRREIIRGTHGCASDTYRSAQD